MNKDKQHYYFEVVMNDTRHTGIDRWRMNYLFSVLQYLDLHDKGFKLL